MDWFSATRGRLSPISCPASTVTFACSGRRRFRWWGGRAVRRVSP